MHTWGEAIPSKQIDAEEDAFQKEGKSLESEGQTDDRAGKFGECRPEEAQLKLNDDTGNSTNGEEDKDITLLHAT